VKYSAAADSGGGVGPELPRLVAPSIGNLQHGCPACICRQAETEAFALVGVAPTEIEIEWALANFLTRSHLLKCYRQAFHGLPTRRIVHRACNGPVLFRAQPPTLHNRQIRSHGFAPSKAFDGKA
jgi:hypothetical protein